MKEILKILNKELKTNLKLNYCLIEYDKSEVKYPYLIGTYIEDNNTNEDNRKSGEFILSAFTKNKLLELENVADNIQEHFKFFSTDIDNSVISIEYDRRQPVDTNDKKIKRLDIYLKYIKWKGVN